MPRGGRREGAGRKPNPPASTPSQMLKRYHDSQAIAASGLTPLEVMIEAMRFFRSQAAKEMNEANPDRKLVRDSLQLAAAIGKDAAPYMHARISVNDGDPHAKMGKKELRDLMAKTAGGEHSEWGDDLRPPRSEVN